MWTFVWVTLGIFLYPCLAVIVNRRRISSLVTNTCIQKDTVHTERHSQKDTHRKTILYYVSPQPSTTAATCNIVWIFILVSFPSSFIYICKRNSQRVSSLRGQFVQKWPLILNESFPLHPRSGQLENDNTRESTEFSHDYLISRNSISQKIEEVQVAPRPEYLSLSKWNGV